MTIIIKYIWKVWLRLNLLTKESDNNYIAEVSTVGDTARNEDIVKAIIDDGSEIKADTLLSILNQGDRIKRSFLVEGRSVQDGVSHITPRVYGNWIGANAKFDETLNTVGMEMTLAPEMRELLKSVKVESLGVKNNSAYIGKVINAATGLANDVIMPGDDTIIEGDRIKIAPENDSSIGVFFKNIETGTVYPVTKRLTQNNPKKIIARTPDLPAGKYSLYIVTRFSQSKQLLLAARTIVYDRPLEVKQA
jgi:hypothetical protein